MREQTKNKYIGKTFGAITVIDINSETYNKENQVKRTYFNCKCNRCGNKTIIRSDRFSLNSKYTPKSCTSCINNLQKEIAEKKYKILETKWLRGRINSIKSNAKTRNINIEINNDTIESIINKQCYYCGDDFAKGIDRLDSSKSYSIENCVPCCYVCNRMKNKYSKDLFLEKVYKIYKNHIESSTTISKESTLQANGNGKGEPLSASA